jgi:hypothetical protein
MAGGQKRHEYAGFRPLSTFVECGRLYGRICARTSNLSGSFFEKSDAVGRSFLFHDSRNNSRFHGSTLLEQLAMSRFWEQGYDSTQDPIGVVCRDFNLERLRSAPRPNGTAAQ